jgi:hypothetical protein
MTKRLRHILGFAAVLGLGVWVAVAIAGTRVTVHTPDGDRKRVNVASVSPDKEDETYTVKGQPRQVTGVSLRKLLATAGVGFGSWRSVEIGPAHMSKPEYRDFGDTPPVFYVNGGAKFLIPDRGGPNGKVYGEPLTVESFAVEGGVVVRPGSATIKVGESVSFTAEPFGDLDPRRYVWTLDGSDSKTGDEATFRFPSQGSYTVRVEAKGEGEEASDTAQITVDAKKSDTDDGSGSTGSTDPGVYTPPATDSDYPTPDTDIPTTPDTTTPTTPTTPDLDPEAPGFSGIQVAGELMSATASPPGAAGEEEPFELPAVGAGPEPVDDPEFTVSGAALLVGSVLGLVGVGAGSEFERLHPRRWLRRRSWMKRPRLSALRRLLHR